MDKTRTKLVSQKDKDINMMLDKAVKNDPVRNKKEIIVENKVKSIVTALENNVNAKDDKKLNQVEDKILDNNKGEKIKDAFRIMLESAKGGIITSNSPGRKIKKKLGGLKPPGKQSRIEECFRRTKKSN